MVKKVQRSFVALRMTVIELRMSASMNGSVTYAIIVEISAT